MPDVTISGLGGVSLSATLELPKGAGRAAGVVLIAGSGPTDRNGNQLPALKTDLLAEIARALAAKGVASVRYDKRGIAASGKPEKGESMAAFFDWENFVGDVEAAAAFLKSHPRIDPKRVGLLGHSEGGSLALEAAPKVKPYAMVLAATVGRPLAAVIHDQLVRLLKSQKATPEQTAFYLKRHDEISEAIRKTGKVPDGVPPGLAALYPAYLGPFLQGDFSVDPAKSASRLACPTLVLQGERDVQVSATLDAPALNRALKCRHALAVIPGASHNFKRVGSPTDPGIAGSAMPEALKRAADWFSGA